MESHLSLDNQRARLVDLGLDAVSTTLVALLVFVELLLVAHWALNRRARRGTAATGPRVARDGAGVVMRPAAFTFLLTFSFLLTAPDPTLVVVHT